MNDFVEPQYSEEEIESMLVNLYNKNPLATSNKSEEELIKEIEIKYLYSNEELNYEQIAAEYNITVKQLKKIAQKRFWNKRKSKLKRIIDDSYKTLKLAHTFPDLISYGLDLHELDKTFTQLYEHINSVLNNPEEDLSPKNLESLSRVMDSILRAKKDINNEQKQLLKIAKERLDEIDQNDDEIDEQQVLTLIERLKTLAAEED